jgi:hypothetical protein
MSTISSGTTLTTALVQIGDTTGDLVIKTGASNTTAMTISGANQGVTFANAVTYNGTVVFSGGLTGNAAGLTSLNGSNVTSGTVAVARLAATGTPSASTFLRGDSSWTAVPSPNNGTLTMSTSGTGLSGSATFTADQSGNSTFTVTSNATNANTAGAIVARDGSGNFSAGTITANGSGLTSLNASNISSGTLAVANGGTGTASPSLVGGTNITISGSWPNQTVTAASGAPTTAQVLSATAGASFNAVGTYCLVCRISGDSTSNANYSAGNNQYQLNSITIAPNVESWSQTNNLSGTWKWMSGNGGQETQRTGIALRIS